MRERDLTAIEGRLNRQRGQRLPPDMDAIVWDCYALLAEVREMGTIASAHSFARSWFHQKASRMWARMEAEREALRLEIQSSKHAASPGENQRGEGETP